MLKREYSLRKIIWFLLRSATTLRLETARGRVALTPHPVVGKVGQYGIAERVKDSDRMDWKKWER